MSDLFEPYAQLVEIVVLGRRLRVPEKNSLLRQLQFVAPEVATGRFCWNADCRLCEVEYRTGESEATRTALACQLQGQAGMRITSLSPELRYQLSALLRARPAEAAKRAI